MIALLPCKKRAVLPMVAFAVVCIRHIFTGMNGLQQGVAGG